MHDAWYFPRGYADFAETSHPGIYIHISGMYFPRSFHRAETLRRASFRFATNEALIKLQLVQM